MTYDKFVMATANLGKIREMSEILVDFDIGIVSRKELGIDIIVDETSSTYFGNALLKAEAICKASGLPAIADDSGLEVEALGCEPGVYSSSYGGEHLDDCKRCLYLLKKMEGLERRAARFVCTIVCMYPDGGIITAHGECKGEIAYAPRGSGGFGYDPVFVANGTDKTFAELSQEEKNMLSHRGKALRALREQFVISN